MHILLIGSGCREHALSWKIKQSTLTEKIYCWPSSTTIELETLNTKLSEQSNYEAIAKFIKEKQIDLTICGPEKPLSEGMTDAIQAYHPCKIIGPSQKAAKLEASKLFAKDIMQKAKIPTAHFEMAYSYEEAWQKSRSELQKNSGVVIKADGLAGGKGVFVCKSETAIKQALIKLEEILPHKNQKLLIEEQLIGREFSYFALINQKHHIPLGCAVDFKRLGVSDTGPNTGGMGAYTPVPWLPHNWESCTKEQIIDPLLKQLALENINYTGILYCGLMLTDSGIKVIEFNVRLGDPEAQVLLANDSRDWLALFLEALEKKEGYTPFVTPKHKSLGIVMSSHDYPYCTKTTPQYKQSLPHSFFENQSSPYCFGASIKKQGEFFYPQKGRVLTVVGQSLNSFREAKKQAENKVSQISSHWTDSYWRSDIGSKLMEEEK